MFDSFLDYAIISYVFSFLDYAIISYVVSFLDSATMVREAAVDLVGKFILHKQELIDKYYDMLLPRILVSLFLINSVFKIL